MPTPVRLITVGLKNMKHTVPLFLAFILCSCAGGGAYPRSQSGVGYPSAEAALADLKTKPGVEVREEIGWTVATDRASYTVWSFAPAWHPAHPAVVKRTAVERDGAVYVETKVLCQASKQACDALVEDFKQLNERARQSMQR